MLYLGVPGDVSSNFKATNFSVNIFNNLIINSLNIVSFLILQFNYNFYLKLSQYLAMDGFHILILFQFIEPLIIFPFSISTSNKSLLVKEQYSITSFFLDHINHEFYTTFDIGTPSQKIFALISSDSHTFSLSSENFIPKYIIPNNELQLFSQKGYNSIYSSSFKKIKNIKIFSKIPKNRAIISETISLYNSLNTEKISKIKIENISMIYDDDKNDKFAIIGLNYETSNREIPYIVNELKKLNIIKTYNWSFKFISKTEGQFIIDSLPDETEKNFNPKAFTKILSSSPGDYSYPWSIHFNQLYFIKNDNKFIISQITKCTLVPELGFIIGNSKYKNLILENYFNDLINNNICHLEKTEITKYNKSYTFYGTTGIYELIYCDKDKFSNNKINYKKQFMPLLYDLPKYNYTFKLDDNDLFIEINNRYYYLVAFPENKNESSYIHCFLGLPFYQKYRLVFNFDSKTIGFYNQEYEENQNNIDIDKNKRIIVINKSNENLKRIIFEILICILFILIAFFIGKKINEKRKKRANELNDDNFEYILDNNKDINKKLFISDNIIIEKGNKFMEMSSNIK